MSNRSWLRPVCVVAIAGAASCAAGPIDAAQSRLLAPAGGANLTEGVDEPYQADADATTHGSSTLNRTQGYAFVQTWNDNSFPPSTVGADGTIDVVKNGGIELGSSVHTGVTCNYDRPSCSNSKNFTVLLCSAQLDVVSAHLTTDHSASWIIVHSHTYTSADDSCASNSDGFSSPFAGGSAPTQIYYDSGQCYEWWHATDGVWVDMGQVCF